MRVIWPRYVLNRVSFKLNCQFNSNNIFWAVHNSLYGRLDHKSRLCVSFVLKNSAGYSQFCTQVI